MNRPVVALAGASGDLGARIARALIGCGAEARALIRDGIAPTERARLEALGLNLVTADPRNPDAIASACAGAACVVSALNGVRDVMIERQSVLLEGAVRAGVPHFIPSDYSADFTRTRPGDKRNLDLRREFTGIVDRAPIRATSILNGAFMDMLGAAMPIIQPRIRRVLYWRDADQPLDFTTKDDSAAYTAAAALDNTAPRILRVAGDVVSARELAGVMTEVTGQHYRLLWAGSIRMLGAMIAVTRRRAPGTSEAFPPWEGMPYMRDQFSGRGKLSPLENGRRGDLRLTSVADMMLTRRRKTKL